MLFLPAIAFNKNLPALTRQQSVVSLPVRGSNAKSVIQSGTDQANNTFLLLPLPLPLTLPPFLHPFVAAIAPPILAAVGFVAPKCQTCFGIRKNLHLHLFIFHFHIQLRIHIHSYSHSHLYSFARSDQLSLSEGKMLKVFNRVQCIHTRFQ